jgi:hypothetical protein
MSGEITAITDRYPSGASRRPLTDDEKVYQAVLRRTRRGQLRRHDRTRKRKDGTVEILEYGVRAVLEQLGLVPYTPGKRPKKEFGR